MRRRIGWLSGIVLSVALVACGTGDDEGGPNGGSKNGSDDGMESGNEVVIEELPTGSGEGGGTGEPKEPEVCAAAKVEFEVRIPQVWMLLDQSGSMDSTISPMSSDKRWDTLGSVLLGEEGDDSDVGVVGEFQSQVAFGSTFFTSTGSGSSCSLNLDSVDIALDNHAAIENQYSGLRPDGRTPTAESLEALTATAVAAESTSGPKIIILATDGRPNNCTASGDAEANVEAAVQAAHGEQILTFLVFIGSEQDDDHREHLQSIANLGVGKPADSMDPAEYYTAENEAKLREAFSTIIGGARGCVIDIDGEVEAASASKGKVNLNGTNLKYKDADGWDLVTPSQVELLGAACDEIKDGETNLEIEFPCGSVTPIPR